MKLVVIVLVRTLATRGRLIGLGALGLGAIGLGIAVRTATTNDRAGVAFSLIDGYGLALLVPVVALVFSSAALGDLAEDGTLVYLWLRPLARWRLAMAAFLASLALAVPVAVVPLVVAAAATGTGWKLVGASAAGGLLAAAAYSAVFCGLGLRVRRALAWGLAYLLIWEQAVARVSRGAARASLFVNTRSLTASLAHHSPLPQNSVSPLVGLLFPLVAVAAALFLTSRSLDRGEIA
jgi:ABC-2 type transport system permease protein